MPKDVLLSIDKDTAELLWYLYVYIIPGVLLLSGIIILLRRRESKTIPLPPKKASQ